MGDKNIRKHVEKGRAGFLPNNPGRPKGSVSKSVLTARKLMAEYSDEIMKVAIDMVIKDKDAGMTKFLAGKLLGKIDAGINPRGNSPAEMLRSIIKQVSKNGLSADDAAGQVEIIKALTQAIELEDVEARLQKLENAK